MKSACDEQSPACRGNEREEPNEPPPREECMIRVYGGYARLREWLDTIKPLIYEYNSAIRHTGYYLKPVHKVYYKRAQGETRIYEYYGRYWWKIISKGGKRRLVYAGRFKPSGVPEPPKIELEGLRVVVEGDDVIIECDVYDKVKRFFGDLPYEILS